MHGLGVLSGIETGYLLPWRQQDVSLSEARISRIA